VAHRNDFSLDIVQEEDDLSAQERILQKKQQQQQQRIEEIIADQQDQEGRLERERQKKADEALARLTLTSDDLGADQIRRDLQLDGELDDLPSSAGDFFVSKKSHDDSDTHSDADIEANVTTSPTRVCINYTDESIENEFETTKLEDIEFGRRESKLYQEEEDLDVSELGRLFEASQNDDDILKDESSSRRSAKSSSKGSRRTASTLESAIRPIKNVMKKSASNIDSKTTSNIRRRNKRLWKFCVWNCRKITMCVILSIGIFVAIGVLAWLGAVKNKQANNPGEDGTVEKDTATKTGNGLEGVEQPLVAEPEFILQPLKKRPTQYPSLSPSQSLSQSPSSIIMQDGLEKVDPPPVNDTASSQGNETEASFAFLANESPEPVESPSSVPSISPPVVAMLVLSPTNPPTPTNPPISINVPTVETDIIGVMTFSEPVPQDTEADLIVFLDALKKSMRSAVSPSLYTNEDLRYVEIISIDGEAVDSLLLRRRFLRRVLQTGSSVAFNIVILTECDFSGCTDVDTVADDVFTRVKNEMTTSVSSGAFASTLEVNMASSSGGTLEYVTGVELGDFSEPTVTVLSSMGDYGANETDIATPIDVDSTSSAENSSTLVGNETTTTSTTPVDVDPKANETNLTLIDDDIAVTNANEVTTTNATIITDNSVEDENQLVTSNATIENSNVTSNSVVSADEDGNITLGDNGTLPPYPNGNSTTGGSVANETLLNFANSTFEENEGLSAESGKDTTISFNISALDALFLPSLTLVASETNSPLTSNPDDVIANMENSETDNGTSFNATLFANETFSVSYLNETSSNTTEESLT